LCLTTEDTLREEICMPEKRFNVLFLCTGNSARSIFAESILNRLGKGRFNAYSAGSHPRGEVNPHALAELARNGYGTTGLRSKDWIEFEAPDAPTMDFVFTVCDRAAAEVCPVWPGQPMTAHWGVEDPALASGDDEAIRRVFAQVFRELHNRILLFTSLSLGSLDRLRLQQALDGIGRSRVDDVEEKSA
jgi:arsenate reductase (thioredoxin)